MNNQELVAFAESAIRQAYECQDDMPFGLSEEEQAEVRLFEIALAALTAEPVKVPSGWQLVPVEPTESMVIDGFESEPDPDFSTPSEWAVYEAMSGCQQAAHRARLCWAAMLAAAPVITDSGQVITDSGEMITDKKEDKC